MIYLFVSAIVILAYALFLSAICDYSNMIIKTIKEENEKTRKTIFMLSLRDITKEEREALWPQFKNENVM